MRQWERTGVVHSHVQPPEPLAHLRTQGLDALVVLPPVMRRMVLVLVFEASDEMFGAVR